MEKHVGGFHGGYKYNEGDYIGTKGVILIKRTSRMPCGAWRGLFLCPFHEEQDKHYFESDIQSVASDKKYHCGCQGKRKQKIEDLTGKQFGRLTVVQEFCRISSKEQTSKEFPSIGVYWLCKCSCSDDSFIKVTTSNLKSGGVRSCGCLSKESKQEVAKKVGEKNRIDITNQKSGTWTALYRTDKKQGSSFLWECVCENGHHNLISTSNWGKIKFCKQCKNQHYSKGEYCIQNFLERYEIPFKKEYSFQDCRDKRPLRFDFYLSDYNICIEYDGEQHFKKTSFSHENFNVRQYHDYLKDEYCQLNEIKLVRFDFQEYSIMDDKYMYKKIFGKEL